MIINTLNSKILQLYFEKINQIIKIFIKLEQNI
jgi:hypothetical protein